MREFPRGDDMLTLREGEDFRRRVLVHNGLWRCPDCTFGRYYATRQGALRGVCEHMRLTHNVRLTLPSGQARASGGSREEKA